MSGGEYPCRSDSMRRTDTDGAQTAQVCRNLRTGGQSPRAIRENHRGSFGPGERGGERQSITTASIRVDQGAKGLANPMEGYGGPGPVVYLPAVFRKLNIVLQAAALLSLA